MMPSPSIEDQLRAKMNIPSPSYSTPVGVALPKQGKYTEDVAGILDLYKDRIDPRPNDNDKQRLREEFDKLSAEGRPAFHWIQEAICRTSAKVRAEQRNIAYMLGILKNWRAYGYGTDYSAEHKKMFTIFERRFDCFMTDTSRQKLLELIDNHGVVDAMDALYNTTEEDIDPSLRLVMQMEVFLSRSEA